MRLTQKVVAYIVRDDRIVVFTHTDDERPDESGLQVPAGTVHDGELPERAVLREAYEETGLDGLRIVRYLGVAEYDMRPYVDQLAIRHFYHLAVDGEVPERWDHHELGDGDTEPIRFSFYWLSLRQAQVLIGGQGALLGRLFDQWT